MAKYQAYPEYKDSEVEWVGNYPHGWFLTRVKFESYVKARVGWHGLKSDDFTDEGPYLVTGSDFKGPIIQWENCYHCDLSRYEQDPYIQLKEGDLLITKDGTIGKVALVSGLNGLATLNSGVFVVRPLCDNYISRFYFWLLQSSVFTGFVDFNKTGSTIVHLYQDTFVNFLFAMPSLIEQETIANFLDHETAKIDTLIEKQQQLIQLLKEKRQAVISHAVTKGLNPNALMKDSGVEWLGQVPAHWNTGRLAYQVDLLVDGTHHSPESNFEGEFLYITAKNIKEHGFDFSEITYVSETAHKEIYSRCSVKKGDVLYIKDGATAGVAMVNDLEEEFSLLSSVAVIRPRKEIIKPEFLKHHLNASVFKNEMLNRLSGGAMTRFTIDGISRFSLILPPIEEQEQIVGLIERMSVHMDALIDQAQQAIQLMQERRTALISAAVTGKIDVRNWQAPTN